MRKHLLEDETNTVLPAKRRHTERTSPDEDATIPPRDFLSTLSDELILLVLSFLPTSSIIICQSLSRRFHILAGDSELWKHKYYSRWVWPRAKRIPHTKNFPTVGGTRYTPKAAQWLGHKHTLEDTQNLNWKGQYRLRHNWSKGSCRVTEVEVAQPQVAPILVRLCDGIVFTADPTYGLRVWSMKEKQSCLTSFPFARESDEKPQATPSALSVISNGRSFDVIVGFQTGNFSVYSLDKESNRIVRCYSGPSSPNGAIVNLASLSSHILVLSGNRTLSLYRRYSNTDKEPTQSVHLKMSLKANNFHFPASLSIRSSCNAIVASVTYTFPHLSCGWAFGLQELRIGENGEDLGSRLITTVDLQFNIGRTISPNSNDIFFRSSHSSQLTYTMPPTSLSYSHPYLLTSHADNTLTMFLINSTNDELFVKTAYRLWGHTSSVSGVEVSGRGTAVSISARDNDIRIWELEDLIASGPISPRARHRGYSVRISPGNIRQPKSLELGFIAQYIANKGASCTLDQSLQLNRTQVRVGFDDERVVVLRERDLQAPMLKCYDFT